MDEVVAPTFNPTKNHLKRTIKKDNSSQEGLAT